MNEHQQGLEKYSNFKAPEDGKELAQNFTAGEEVSGPSPIGETNYTILSFLKPGDIYGSKQITEPSAIVVKHFTEVKQGGGLQRLDVPLSKLKKLEKQP